LNRGLLNLTMLGNISIIPINEVVVVVVSE